MFSPMMLRTRLRSFCHRLSARARHAGEAGASLIEYALLAVLIAVACLAAVRYFGDTTSHSFSTSASQISNAPGG